ncbi:50S ribosomal protein L10 [Candidatus Woesearchaeota archaeon]|nr:50S ribosomal protein L10 [Candidatus Woesearchaeota archaeon]
MSEKTHHASEKKKKIAGNIQRLIAEYPIIAAVDMENLPAPQLQQMRSQLRGKIEIAMTKRRIMKHAIEGVKGKKENIEKLEPHLKGMPALIFTKENPFSLFKTLKKSKTSAPAKAGQTAPFDLIVPKGPTSFMPGPVIGELAQLGIKSGVEGGKVAIKEDSVVVEEGKKISAKAAEILTRLGIEPMEVGLNITAVYENGEIFTKDILDIDEDKFKADLEKAASGAFNLAVNIEYPTKETINVLIGKAFNEAKALGISEGIIDEGIVEELLSKAERSALSLKSSANIETVENRRFLTGLEKQGFSKTPEKPKQDKKEEKAEEEKTEEGKKEEKILEEEKEIIKEEKKLEKEAKKKDVEAPVEKEVKQEVKEEEEKKLEAERIEKEKEFEKAEEEKKKETPEEKKEEKILEEEKEIIKEEKKLEKEAKKKDVEAPVEKEVKEEIKEEEEKKLEAERIEKEKELEDIEEKKEESHVDTDKKIAEMVAKTKKFVKGEIPDAERLIEEASILAAKEAKSRVKEKKVKVTKPAGKEEKEKVPTIQELQEKKKKEVANLAQELVKKGTLRE